MCTTRTACPSTRSARSTSRPPRRSVAGRDPGRDVHLVLQRALHGAALGDLEQPQALLTVQRAMERDVLGDLIEKALARLAVRAVLGVYARVAQRHFDGLQWPALALGVEPHGHRRA